MKKRMPVSAGLLAIAALLQSCMTGEAESSNPANPQRKRLRPGAIAEGPGVVKTGNMDGQPITYVDYGGQAVVHGDIVLPARELEPLSLPKTTTGLEASASTGRISRSWPNNIFYYTLGSNLTNPSRVENAILHWQANTKLRFVRWHSQVAAAHPNYVTFRNPLSGELKGCYSTSLGMPFGQGAIVLQDDNQGFCGQGVVIHEIGHAAGLFHEQSRSDRGNSIIIHWNRIVPSGGLTYQQIEAQYLAWNDPRFASTFGVPISDGWNSGAFDFGSIMLYSPLDFSNGNDPVMTKTDGKTTWPPNYNVLSNGDKSGILYKYPSIWTYVSGLSSIRDIGVGGTGSGIGWATAGSSISGGYRIYRRNGTTWQLMPGAATRLDVDQYGNAWAVNSFGDVFYWNGSGWEDMNPNPEDPYLRDITVAAGGVGEVWGITNIPASGGYRVVNWRGGYWAEMGPSRGGLRISVGVDGRPWITDNQHRIFRWTDSSWEQYHGAAEDVAVGADGSVYALGTSTTGNGYKIYIANGMGSWTNVEGGALQIDVGPDGNPWAVISSGTLYN